MSSRLAWRAPLGALIPLGVFAVTLPGAQAPPDRHAPGEGVEHPEDREDPEDPRDLFYI
jgi:hypothetical protein